MADPHSATHAHPAAAAHRPLYFVPAPSRWPVVGGTAMIFTMFGAAMIVNHNSLGWFSLAIGLATLVYMLIGWFSIVSHESERGDYNRKVDVSFRWGMSWFIFSEVMFFA
ncbi:MAG TPA: cytochrome c oxidase subunit 3, partial [Burkholderiaceae bacterium]|nr:cytochrome c oxidase subunit 3 [Burkholderiaceae bacterium]